MKNRQIRQFSEKSEFTSPLTLSCLTSVPLLLGVVPPGVNGAKWREMARFFDEAVPTHS